MKSIYEICFVDLIVMVIDIFILNQIKLSKRNVDK